MTLSMRLRHCKVVVNYVHEADALHGGSVSAEQRTKRGLFDRVKKN